MSSAGVMTITIRNADDVTPCAAFGCLKGSVNYLEIVTEGGEWGEKMTSLDDSFCDFHSFALVSGSAFVTAGLGD